MRSETKTNAADVATRSVADTTSFILGGAQSEGVDLDISYPSVDLAALASGGEKWIGDTTMHRFGTVSGEFGTWGTNVAKLDLLFRDDRLPFFPKQTTLRSGFGSQSDETSDGADESDSFWTQGQLQEHPLWG